MRVLLTGASSFTGAWFARALAEAGCEVVAALRGPDESGPAAAGPRARRLALVRRQCLVVPEAPFGSPAFLAAVRDLGPFDLLCHHGAEVGDHLRPDFDVAAAVAANTRNVDPVLDALAERSGGRAALLVTGSVFEADEGRGEAPLRAFNPYGLAKTVTWHHLRFAAERRGLAVGKLVVPAPFGPLEKEGFTAGLMRAWLRGETPVVRRPLLVRDHVPVRFLAGAYARFARLLPARRRASLRAGPGCFALPLTGFARKLAAAMRPRLGVPCRFLPADPPERSDEPLVRRNTEPVREVVDPRAVEAMWDEYATYWRKEVTQV